MSRMPASRLARIGAWTAAALAWGTTAVVVRAATTADDSPTTTQPSPQVSPSGVKPILPAPPDGGLVVLRFTPVTAPPQQIVVETRYVESQVKRSQSSTATKQPVTTKQPAASPSGDPSSASQAPPPPPPQPQVASPAPQPPSPPSAGS